MLPGKMPVKYEQVTGELAGEIFHSHVLGGSAVASGILDSDAYKPLKYELYLCGGPKCQHRLPWDAKQAFKDSVSAAGLEHEIALSDASCFGLCGRAAAEDVVFVLVRPSNVVYRVTRPEDVEEIVQKHLKGGRPVEQLVSKDEPISRRFFDLYGDVAFFHQQSRIALRNSGIIDPRSIEEYIYYRGFAALAKVLGEAKPASVIEQISQSNLRGRGGAGYPTGTKWRMAASQQADRKYIICNADEGDPGAFMDRSMLEGDPFSVLEGMAIGAYAISNGGESAISGYFYIRAEYPMAIKRVTAAIGLARKWGLLGKNILDSGFDFDVDIRLGAGAFVCGEETSLIHSIQGERGQPHIRPPYPTTKGLWGKPTVINNVETLANVPAVIDFGPKWFSQIGTERSGGTKVFALAGKVRHTGLVEVPMGTTLREIVFDIGGGPPGGVALKAVQTGGPAGGVIPASQIDTIVDFDTLTAAGSIMGSGGMIVMDQTDCMVDIARYYMSFSQDESCGKCTPCREGTMRMLEILTRICNGEGKSDDLDKLERLGKLIKKASLCGLGRAAPNPVLSTLKHFRHEYEAHVNEKRCPVGKCPMKAVTRAEPVPSAVQFVAESGGRA